MGRASVPILTRSGINITNAVLAATTNLQVQLDVSRVNKLFVTLFVIGAASINDVTYSVDAPALGGGVYNADQTPAVQPPLPPATAAGGAALFNAGLTIAARNLWLDASMVSVAYVRIRNTTAGGLLVRADAYAV